MIKDLIYKKDKLLLKVKVKKENGIINKLFAKANKKTAVTSDFFEEFIEYKQPNLNI